MINVGEIPLGISDSFASIQPFMALVASDSIQEVGRLYIQNNVLQFDGSVEDSIMPFFSLLRPIIDDYVTRTSIEGLEEVPTLRSSSNVVNGALTFTQSYVQGLYMYDTINGWQTYSKAVQAIGPRLPTENGAVDNREFYSTVIDGTLFYLSAPYPDKPVGVYMYKADTKEWLQDNAVTVGTTFPKIPVSQQLFYLNSDLNIDLDTITIVGGFVIFSGTLGTANVLFAETQATVSNYIRKALSYPHINRRLGAL